MAKNNVNVRRAQARKLQRSVSNKISRIKSSKGVLVAGTEFDPRKPAAEIGKMNSRQLDSYSRQLSNFVSRETQFVGDAESRAMPVKEWRAFEASKAKATEMIVSRFDKVKNILNPFSGQTTGQRRATITPEHRTAYNPTVNLVNAPPDLKPGMIASVDALRQLKKDMDKRSTERFFQRRHAQGRIELGQMLSEINNPKLASKVNGLTADQFEFLWNETDFAKYVSQYYETVKLLKAKKTVAFANKTAADALKRGHKLVEWVKGLEEFKKDKTE